jgi:signal transduction histidine kinase
MDAERLVAAGRIASMVGHDLRGPLQTIKNAVYLLERTPENMGEMLGAITQAVDYAVGMLEELRNTTRDSPLKIVETDLGASCREPWKRPRPAPRSMWKWTSEEDWRLSRLILLRYGGCWTT